MEQEPSLNTAIEEELLEEEAAGAPDQDKSIRLLVMILSISSSGELSAEFFSQSVIRRQSCWLEVMKKGTGE